MAIRAALDGSFPLDHFHPKASTLMRIVNTTLAGRLGSPAVRFTTDLLQPKFRGRVFNRPTAAGVRTLTGICSTAEAGSPGRGELGELARLEAVLLLASEPLSTRKLAKLAGLADGTKARSLIQRLRRRLAERGSAMEPVDVAGGVQLLTRPQLGDWLSRQNRPREELRLSAPALETLSVAAYRQPVLRAEIEAIRGVGCGEILRVLMERGLLRIVGRSDELGRPFLYGTTREFLRIFGLQRLEQLPPIDQTRNAESPSAEQTSGGARPTPVASLPGS